MAMKLFISYSSDDKAWVFELWRALRNEAYHDAWLDQRIVPATDWWATILDNVEACECFIYVLTPKAVNSIYCQAELKYALALNKPVLPLMLKQCDYPAALEQRRIQYQIITENMNLDRLLFKIEQALGEIRIGIVQGKYVPQSSNRPAAPKPKKNQQVFEVYEAAEDAAEVKNFSLAEQLYQQIIDADPKGLGFAAQERLNEIERIVTLDGILKMAANPTRKKGATAALRVYIQQYGEEEVPQELVQLLADDIKSKHISNHMEITGEVVVHPERLITILLPPPFDWCEIPAGNVEIEGYGDFEVAAFLMAKYPITVAQYEVFIKAGGYEHKNYWTKAGWQWRKMNNIMLPRFWNEADNQSFLYPNHPIIGVSWYESLAFCKWLSVKVSEDIRLPTEQQWQWAAVGGENWRYPWGNEFDVNLCNTIESQIHRTSSVTQYPKGRSPFGVMDMSGNVWEWTLSDYQSSNSADLNRDMGRVLRGGSWADHFANAHSITRTYDLPKSRDGYKGLRIVCVRF